MVNSNRSHGTQNVKLTDLVFTFSSGSKCKEATAIVRAINVLFSIPEAVAFTGYTSIYS